MKTLAKKLAAVVLVVGIYAVVVGLVALALTPSVAATAGMVAAPVAGWEVLKAVLS